MLSSARMARKLRWMECAKYMAKQEMQTHFGWNRSLNDIIYLFIYVLFDCAVGSSECISMPGMLTEL